MRFGFGKDLAMTRQLARLIILAALVVWASAPALAGSSDSRKSIPYQKEILFSGSDFSFAGGPHELRTAVYGNPFGADRAQVETSVIAAMQTTNWFWQAVKPSVTFTPELGSDDWRSLHIAVYLDAEPLADPKACCAAAGGLDFAAPSKAIAIRFVFCSGTRLYSTTVATSPTAATPEDDDFRKLVGQMTRGLWPLRYLGVQLGSSQVLLEYRQRNTANPELFGYGFNTVRQFLGPGSHPGQRF